MKWLVVVYNKKSPLGVNHEPMGNRKTGNENYAMAFENTCHIVVHTWRQELIDRGDNHLSSKQ